MKGVQLLKIKAQVHGIWVKGCVLDDYVGVISLNMTIPPCWNEKVMVYYFIIITTLMLFKSRESL